MGSQEGTLVEIFMVKKRVGSTTGSQCNMDDDLPINNDRHDLNDMLDDLDDDVAQKKHAKFEKLFVAAEKALFREFLHQEMLLDDNELPISTYQAKKLMCPMDLEIERIDACLNDCMLYRGSEKDLHACKWEHLQVQHSLDVMHIEKIVCGSLVGLLLNILGKTKDGVNVRNDMEDIGIQPKLASKVILGKHGKYLPPASYTMSKIEKTKFVNVCMVLRFHLAILLT
ncbi:hypothetical protein Tco_0265428 [Tanacetum coccineum]